jgi:ABC-2 type transport system permease protein
MFRAMVLGLVRDRGALVLAFLLPPTIFMIFASVFSGTGGTELRLKVAVGGATPAALEQVKALLEHTGQAIGSVSEYAGRDEIASSVEAGEADVGLFARAGLDSSDRPFFVILVDPAKKVAGAVLSGELQRIVASHVPQLGLRQAARQVESAVGGFSADQSVRLEIAIETLSTDGERSGPEEGVAVMEEVGATGKADAAVTYYAGAVAILFLLFSAFQSAAALIDERNSGILDRVAVGPASTDIVVLGKFLFLTVQGITQAALIFVLAWLVYDVDILADPGGWLLITFASAAMAAGLALAAASACTTRQQATTVSTFVVLVCSAVGGSMVPRFMMPPWLQEIGWLTPNAWAIEAYYDIMWRGDGIAEIAPKVIALLAVAIFGLSFGLAMSRLRLRL